ncbi:facilitated trehalose transporter Tret1-2 homolog [Anneissia japonica]|uniref:facilitated trehalose transporter Tret1-2 homolog n=1 Tax=Anneissia japonica TaxID=1529436 RepID=UPI001425B343|nr:facilitated trehalose transporter Tret1-2 homolog [Anneissia japonica]XP_033110243.1 facilitated trehalose transporter Tret1-2 homolog [Anneissia japonica]XP_033110244.1 facilitated trehalose transporter Tret1-2 homolog [Anneissia japonica]
MLFMPETPHYCIIKHERNKALSVLTWLRGEDYDIEQEYKNIALDLLSTESAGFHYREFFQPNLYIPLAITVTLMMLQQFSGIDAVNFYTVTIFQRSSLSINDHVAVIIVIAVQVVVPFVSVTLIDRCGRKILLIVAGAGMCLSASTFGIYYKLTENVNVNYTEWTATTPPTSLDLTWLSLTSLIVYTSSFSLAWGSIPFLIMSEILPTKGKGPASALATTVNWLSLFVVTKTFLKMSVVMTDAGVFWFFGGVCFLSTIFVALCVPETKGRSLEEITKYFNRYKHRGDICS